jgi:hypothetical protein
MAPIGVEIEIATPEAGASAASACKMKNEP